jgi:superfamily II DNA or RNA helicase
MDALAEAKDQNADWTIINIPMLRDYAPRLTPVWILDEFHHCKNHSSQQAKGALDLTRYSPHVYGLTATPVTREIDDLFMQMRILDPTKWTNYNAFVEQFCFTIPTNWGPKIVGIRDKDTLQSIFRRYALRRTYADVGLQLPEVIETELRFDPPATFKRAYRKVRDEYKFDELLTYDLSDEVVNGMLTALRRMTVAPKLEVLQNLLEDQTTQGTIVYSWYRESAKRVGELLGCPVIDGSVDAKDRQPIAESTGLLSATIASLSESVDLTHFRNVIYFEQHYSPASMKQTLSRIQRWSPHTERNVVPIRATYLMAKGTADVAVFTTSKSRNGRAIDVLRAAMRDDNE